MSTESGQTLLPVRMLNEHVYCPRLFHLMHVQGFWAESADTYEGRSQHARAAERRPARVPIPLDTQPWPAPPRELELADEALGIIGKLDVLEEEPDPQESKSHWAPVETKHAAPPPDERPIRAPCGISLPPGAWDNDQIQLAAQAQLLRAAGYRCEWGYLYYLATRQRVRLILTDNHFQALREEVARARATERGPMPPPLVDSPKCLRCSLHDICLPDETNLILRPSALPPRVVPGRDDLGVLYITEPGARVGKQDETITMTMPKTTEPVTVPFKDVAHLSVFGHVQVSTQLIGAFLESGRSVTFLSSGGRYLGGIFPPLVKNFHLRRAQYSFLDNLASRLRAARMLVFAKIMNCRTLLRRNGSPSDVLTALRGRAREARRAIALDALRGIEGLAARDYFPALARLLKADVEPWDWTGRTRRPPKDPINAMLSLAYSLLCRDVEIALRNAGLEPLAGFYHAPENTRPGLALDLMEPFRPLIAESVVLRAVNTRVITRDSFVVLPAHTSMRTEARRAFLSVYEQRMQETVRHPRFRYSISYRRILELEARLFARFLEGELPDYVPLMTR
ncbi:MAG: CRISPR-associated endonuclease Cas1 [Candidatus Sumerlaeaceae bacterium]|nr:CRISPR-associated endonuclease Cas1 [Candidatus Sumerlaeaceae bacterium]